MSWKFNPFTGTLDWTDASTGSLPTPTQAGQVLFATTSGAFVQALPLTTLEAGWLVNNDGILLVV